MPLTKLPNHKNKILNIWFSGKSSQGTMGAPLDLSAKTVFFIHGLGSSQNFYHALLQNYILPNANAILMDTEGSAQSPLFSRFLPPTSESIVDDVYAILDHLRISHDVIVIGHSMGGMIALKTAADRRGGSTVSKVVGIGAVHPTEAMGPVFSQRIEAVKNAGDVLALADAISSGPALSSHATPLQRAFVRDLISQQTAEGYISMCKVIVDSKPADYNKITQPVLLICGADDSTAPYKGCVDQIETGLSNVKCEILKNVGHWHCIEATDEVGLLISSFL